MNTTVTKTNPLGTERIGKLILTFAVPSIISMVVNALYNIVDQIFIGQGVGYLGNGATNVVMPMTVIAIALSLLIGDGAAAYLSLKLGQGEGTGRAHHGMLHEFAEAALEYGLGLRIVQQLSDRDLSVAQVHVKSPPKQSMRLRAEP